MNPLLSLYDVIDVLKENTNGKVLLVYDKTVKQICVMKERNLNLAEIYSRLKNLKSPYVPEIYRAVKFQGTLFVVEEFIDGRTLEEILTYNNGLNENDAAEILKQVCRALDLLHAQKIIHRDIKPSNIMLTKNNSVKLIDFGISRLQKNNAESDTKVMGTRGYAPPEQFGFGQTDARSDIYSLGVTFQKLLGENYGGYLKKILAKCTEIDPANRYQAVAQILFDVDKFYRLFKVRKFFISFTAAVTLILTFLFLLKNFFTEEKVAEIAPAKVENTAAEISEKPKTPPPAAPKNAAENFKFPEIIFPAAENYHSIVEKTLPQIEAVKNISEDPRSEIACTLTLNGEIYQSTGGEISEKIWQSWQHDGEIFFFPENFSANLNIFNKGNVVLKDITVSANSLGLKGIEKIFPAASIPANNSKNFEISLGGLAIYNGAFNLEIWVRDNEGAPLESFWNEQKFNNHAEIRIYLLNFNKWRVAPN